jgi:ATP-dependent DNA helicase RecG
MEVMSPGGLPLGITKRNILHHTRRKNPHIIDVFKAFGLMEGEGSGYDLIYEKLSRDAKPYPEIESGVDYVKVTIYSTIIDPEVLKILDFAQEHFTLSQKEVIVLGVVAREKRIDAIRLAEILQLDREERLRNWVSSLLEKGLLITHGRTKGVSYLLNPEFLKAMDLDVTPSLKTLEPHALKALIFEDLKVHPHSKASQIAKRLPEVPLSDIRKVLYKAVKEGEVIPQGERKNRTYALANKK